jgi:hypothetical protein
MDERIAKIIADQEQELLFKLYKEANDTTDIGIRRQVIQDAQILLRSMHLRIHILEI